MLTLIHKIKKHLRQKRLVVFFSFLIFLTNSVFATDYYFSDTLGDDTRTSATAQNPATPWKSINQLNLFFVNLKAGDRIFFKRGDVFPGNIIIKKSGTLALPIQFNAYGTGDKPVISGLTTIKNWNSLGNNLYRTNCESCIIDNNLFLINNDPQNLGRYPNSTYLTYESTIANNAIIDNELNSSVDWTGAEVVIRKNRWIIDRFKITSHVGKTINYPSGSKDFPVAGFGYFIQNDLRTLDKDGEWFFDPVSKQINLYQSTKDPNTQNIQASALNNLITINSFSYLTFQNLSFTGANASAIDIRFGQNISILDCDFNNSGSYAITVNASANFILQNSTFNNSLNTAVDLSAGSSNSNISNNVIRNSGMFVGMGKNSSGTYEAIQSFGANAVIEYNVIENTGYNGIYFGGSGSEVRNNFVTNFCLVKDDGGGIYVGDYFLSQGKKITNNIVTDGKGAPNGTNNQNLSDTHGIYIDATSSGLDISNNTIENCGSGIKIGNANSIQMTNNTFFGNEYQQLNIGESEIFANDLVRNIHINNNIFFSKKVDQLTANYYSQKNDIRDFGTADNNFFVRPYDDRVSMLAIFSDNTYKINKSFSLDNWKAYWGNNANSKQSPVTLKPYQINKLVSTNKVLQGHFTSNLFNVFTVSEDNNGQTALDNTKLDGSSLRVSYTTPSKKSSILNVGISNISPLESGKNYLMRFSAMGNLTNRNIGVYLQQATTPFFKLTKIRYLPISPTRTENEFLFTIASSEANVNVIFELNDADGTIWFDNIEIYEADVTVSKPEDDFKLLYNNTKSDKSFTLAGTYIDVKKTKYSTSAVVKPYQSLALIRLSNTIATLSITSSTTFICGTNPITFTASAVNGGANPKFQWKVNGVNTSLTTVNAFVANNLKDKDEVVCELINPDIYSEAIAISNSIIVTTSTVKPSINIAANVNNTCAGTPIIFTASITDGGNNPIYQWKINGVNVPNSNKNSITLTDFKNDDVVSCVLTVINSCQSNSDILSNSVQIKIINPATLKPNISIVANVNNTCTGTPITFTASIIDSGSSPIYQWKINGVNVPNSNKNSLTLTDLKNDDLVSCVLTVTNSCQANGDVTSNIVQVKIITPINLKPTISIAANVNNICAGTPITFTASITDGGSSPAYQWKVNGVNVPTSNKNSLILTDLKNDDLVSCVLTVTNNCQANSDITSNIIQTKVITPSNFKPSITITANVNNTCASTPITFTTSVTDGGSNPVYQWKVNGNNVPNSNRNSLTLTDLKHDDLVSCLLTVTNSCQANSDVPSNTVQIKIVSPTNFKPTIGIVANVNNTCAGIPITFTASITDGGSNPVYQWKVNGINVPNSNRNVLTLTDLKNDDLVSCILTVTNSCQANSDAVSNTVQVKIISATNLRPSISIIANVNNVCAGIPITFTATITDGGSSPVYQWKVNGANVANSNRNSLTLTDLKNDDLVSCSITVTNSCQANSDVTSNSIQVKIISLFAPTISITIDIEKVYINTKITFTITNQNIGSNVILEWKINDKATGEHNTTFTTSQLKDGDVVTCVATVNSECTTSKTVTSNPILIQISKGELDPPNTFTPNGDGINDFWNISGINEYPNCIVQIYTREGRKVFYSNGYQQPWDGNYKGEPSISGVYFYVINLGNKKKISGFVYLTR